MRTCHALVLTGIILGGMPMIGFGQTQLIRIPVPSGPASARQLVAPPNDFVELCIDVKARRPLDWQFDAERPVGFNTHFHRQDAILFPESMTAVIAARGRLVPGGDQDHCWMWINPTAEPVLVRVHFGP
jgi:hypothetical protein